MSDYPGVDLPESSYAANTWPVAAPGFRPAIEEYFRHAQGLARILMCAFTDALGLQPGYFDSMLDHSIDAMKMNNYALPEGEIRISGDMTGMGAHTDFGILTILWADQVPGLQVLSADGVWHGRPTGRRRTLDQPRRRDGTLDERPMALDSAPSRPTYRRWSDHPTVALPHSFSTGTTTPSSKHCQGLSHRAKWDTRRSRSPRTSRPKWPD